MKLHFLLLVAGFVASARPNRPWKHDRLQRSTPAPCKARTLARRQMKSCFLAFPRLRRRGGTALEASATCGEMARRAQSRYLRSGLPASRGAELERV